MPDIGILYLLPLIIAIIYLLVRLGLQQRIGNARPFRNKWTNLAYNLSFVAPFEWFVDKKEDKIKEANRKIYRAGLEEYLDARTLSSLTAGLFFIGIVVFFVILVGLEPIIAVLSFLVGMSGGAEGVPPNILMILRFLALIVAVMLPMSVNIMISQRIKHKQMRLLSDLPLLQMFMSLMLRSDATIEEMFFTLTTTETSYQEIFQVAYRKFLRDREDAFDYLHEEFDGTPITETLVLLENFNEYARVDTVVAIENNQEKVLEDTSQAKQKANQFDNAIAVVSFALPFIGAGLLGLAPVIYMVTQTIQDSI